MVLSSIALILFIVLLGFELMLAVVLGDFCYAGPDEVLEDAGKMLGLDGNTTNLLTYYTKCEGENPLISLLETAADGMGDLNSTLYTTVIPNAASICQDEDVAL